jgi:hypothetical protein
MAVLEKLVLLMDAANLQVLTLMVLWWLQMRER